jgi:hypothetical protein
MPSVAPQNCGYVAAACWSLCVAAIAGVLRGDAIQQPGEVRAVQLAPDGKRIYGSDAKGNTIPDFSYAGYMGGGVRIPDAPVRVTLGTDAQGTDDARRIQAAIDRVASQPPDAAGIRGAVLLRKGKYDVGKPLTISASGVVLRGEGSGTDGTVLRATMKMGGTFIQIAGTKPRMAARGSEHRITDEFAPCGQRVFHVDSTSGLHVGDHVAIVRDTNDKWVRDNGMDAIEPRKDGGKTINWTPGPRELYERIITAIDGEQITLDIALTSAIESQYGGAHLYRYEAPDRVHQVGVENLRAESIWTPGPGVVPKPGEDYGIDLKDPANRNRKVGIDNFNHADTFISIDKAEDVWVRNFSCMEFLYQGVAVDYEAQRVTIQDGQYEAADPSLGYYRVEPHDNAARYAYCLRGEFTLVQRCTTIHARHSFMTQRSVAGPNVFLDCDAQDQDGFSETHQRWSTGVLYDRIGQRIPTALRAMNRGNMGSGHGWSAAYSVLWNCVGTFTVESPPTATNWAVGCSGKRVAGPYGPMQPEAYESWGRAVEPSSLYLAQLKDRLGESAVDQIESQSSH